MALDSERVKSSVMATTSDVRMGIEAAAPPDKNATTAREELINDIAEAIVQRVEDLPWYVSWAVNEKWVAGVISVVVRAVDRKLADWLG